MEHSSSREREGSGWFTGRAGTAAAARDGRLESQPGPHQRCILPITFRRTPSSSALSSS